MRHREITAQRSVPNEALFQSSFHSVQTNLSSNCIWQSSPSSLAPAEFLHCTLEVSRGKIRPAFRQEDKFGEGALPQKKIGKALLASRPNEQIYFCGTAAKDFRQD